MLKVLQQYFMATADERVIPFMTNYFRYQLSELPKTPLGNWTFWAEQRGGNNLLVVYRRENDVFPGKYAGNHRRRPMGRPY